MKKFISTLLEPGLGSYTFLPPYLTYKFTLLSGHGVRKQRPGTVTVEFSIDRGEAGGVAHVGSSLAPTWRNSAFPPDTRG